MAVDIYTDEIAEASDRPIQDYAVVTLGIDWMVKAYVKDSACQEFCTPVYIRVGDIPRILTQVYSLHLCQAEGGTGSLPILSCETVAAKEGAYLLMPYHKGEEMSYPMAATDGMWLEKGWNPARRSLWLGEDVRLRACGDDTFHRVQRILAPRSMKYTEKSRICSFLCAGHRRWVKSAGEEQPIVVVEAPRMMRLVLSGVRWKDTEPPCAISLACTLGRRYRRDYGNCLYYAIEVRGRRISDEELKAYPRAESYASMAASYCEDFC